MSAHMTLVAPRAPVIPTITAALFELQRLFDTAPDHLADLCADSLDDAYMAVKSGMPAAHIAELLVFIVDDITAVLAGEL